MSTDISDWQDRLRELLLEELSIPEVRAMLNLATVRRFGRVSEVVEAYASQLNEFIEEKSSAYPSHISIYGSQIGIDYSDGSVSSAKALHDLTAELEDGWTYDLGQRFITVEVPSHLTIEFSFGDALENQNVRDDIIRILRNHGGTVE